MAIPDIKVFIRKGTIRTIAYVHDDDDALTNATNVSITLQDPDGNTEVNNVNMTPTATGVYEHYTYTDVNDVLGHWKGEVWVTDDGGTPKKTPFPFGFTLKEGL